MPATKSPLSAALVFILVALLGCASPAPPRKPTVKERIEFDRVVGSQLAQQMEPKLSFRRDPSVQSYLSRVGQGLADKTQDLHLPEVRVFLIQDSGKYWRSYALPGGRLYLSTNMLKELQFENEIAAVMAIELGHLLREHVLNDLRKDSADLPVRDITGVTGSSSLKTFEAPKDVDFFGPKGVFSFDQKERAEAIESGVDILYAAGYDPRGVIALIQYFKENSRSPVSKGELDELLEKARQQIALKSPLRNPIVRTEEFVAMLAKIKKL